MLFYPLKTLIFVRNILAELTFVFTASLILFGFFIVFTASLTHIVLSLGSLFVCTASLTHIVSSLGSLLSLQLHSLILFHHWVLYCLYSFTHSYCFIIGFFILPKTVILALFTLYNPIYSYN